MNRPLVWIALVVMGCILIYDFFVPIESTYQTVDCDVAVSGVIVDIGTTRKGISLVVSDVTGSHFCSRGKVLVYIDQGSFQMGQRISVRGSCQSFQFPTNQGQFNEFTYYVSKNIWYRIFATKISVLDSSNNPYRQFLYELKQRIMTTISQSIPGENADVLSSMMIGDCKGSYEETKRLYRESGIMHIIVISGGHIALIAGFIFALLKRCGLYMQVAALLTMCIIIFYGELTGFTISTSRAVIMMLLFLLAKIVGRSYDLLTGLALSSIFILLQSPMQLYQPGFLLSFGTVLGIYLLEPMGKQIIKNRLLQGFLVTISALLFTLPCLLYFFFEITLFAPIVNMFCVPLLSCLLVMAFIALIIGLVWPGLGPFFFIPSHGILVFYQMVCRFFTSLPYHCLITGQPYFPFILLYYIVLLISIFLFMKKRRLMAGLVLLFLFVIFIRKPSSPITMYFLDVGQGDCSVITTSEGHCIMIDGGSSSVSEVGKYTIVPFLKSKGISTIDYIFASHSDQDHINGIVELISNQTTWGVRVNHLVVSQLYEDDELIQAAKMNDTQLDRMTIGDQWTNKFTLTCLYPGKTSPFTDVNDNSLVLKLTYCSFTCMFMGDSSVKTEEEMKSKLVDCDVLKVGHHGSKSSTSDEFLAAVKPEYSIISAGENNRYGHPSKETLDRLSESKTSVYNTILDGAIEVHIDEEKYTLE